MRVTDLKYLIAYIIPISGFISVAYSGSWSYTTVLIAYVFIPLLELITPAKRNNLSFEEKKRKETPVYFQVLLFLNIPLVYGLLIVFLNNLSQFDYSTAEIVGMSLSTSIVLATSGINVAHELGHKPDRLSQFASKILLLPSLYLHFFIEHNKGHHLRVSTYEDPATARYGEHFYFFLIRSVFGQWKDAWKIEAKQNKDGSLLTNQMFQFQIVQMVFVALIYIFFGLVITLIYLGIAIFSFIQLELINYIEHYGLQREKTASGRYEKVTAAHSWNSNHEVGRIVLYELTRHSDHHYKAAKKYQLLDHHDSSPQLPLGYPGSMIMSLIPPLWFMVMNPRVQAIKKP